MKRVIINFFVCFVILLLFICGINCQGLPLVVDLSNRCYFPPVGEQVGPTCTTFAVCYYLLTYYQVKEQREIKNNPSWDPKKSSSCIFSPSFNYNIENRGEKGVSIPSILESLKKFGCAALDVMPDTGDYLIWPSTQAFEQAMWYRIESYGMVFEVSYDSTNYHREVPLTNNDILFMNWKKY